MILLGVSRILLLLLLWLLLLWLLLLVMLLLLLLLRVPARPPLLLLHLLGVLLGRMRYWGGVRLIWLLLGLLLMM